MPFTSPEALKTILGLCDDSQDALLSLYAEAANSRLLTFFDITDTDPTSYDYSYDLVDYTAGFWIRSYPVISVDEVYIGGVLQDADSYYLDSRCGNLGHLRRKSGTRSVDWPIGPQAVRVVHTAGWTDGIVDAALTNAASLLAVQMYNIGPKQGFESERIGQYAYKLGSALGGSGSGAGGPEAGGWPGPVAAVLANYKRPFSAGG